MPVAQMFSERPSVTYGVSTCDPAHSSRSHRARCGLGEQETLLNSIEAPLRSKLVAFVTQTTNEAWSIGVQGTGSVRCTTT